ncbi:MAG: hypothetical protein IJN90_01270 [Bacilli bacterium]|nr:hypothetical protein [Bacilli bacterium]
MEKNQTITISNPSQLFLQVDEFLNLSRKLPSHHEQLQKREKRIFETLGPKSIKEYERILMFQLDLNKVAEQVNLEFQDGIYIDDERDIVHYPYDRTIRTKPTTIDAPTKEKELSPKRVTSIKVGKHKTLQDNSIAIKRIFSTPVLALEDTFETGSKRR